MVRNNLQELETKGSCFLCSPSPNPVAIPMKGIEVPNPLGHSQLCLALLPELQTQPFQLTWRPRDRKIQEGIKQSMLTLQDVPRSYTLIPDGSLGLHPSTSCQEPAFHF